MVEVAEATVVRVYLMGASIRTQATGELTGAPMFKFWPAKVKPETVPALRPKKLWLRPIGASAPPQSCVRSRMSATWYLAPYSATHAASSAATVLPAGGLARVKRMLTAPPPLVPA